MAEQTVSDFVGRNLYHLVYFRQYPVNPNVIKNCFIDSLKTLGVEVVCNDKSRTASITTTTNLNKNNYRPHNFDVLTVLYYEELGNSLIYPINSIKAFEESIYNLWQPEVVLNDEIMRKFRKKGNVMTELFKDIMKSFLLPYLVKYQENMLIPVSREVPKLRKPEITFSILSRNKNMSMGNKFWGIYLDKLCWEKGYPLKEGTNNCERLERLVKDGNLALEDGRKIWNTVY